MSNDIASTERADPRVGASWLSGLEADARAQLMVALLSRFNHDLRTPLNTIAGWTYLLQAPHEPARVAHIAEVVARNTREQTQMLEEFIDDARVIFGVLPATHAPARFDEVTTAAFERLQPLLDLHGVAINLAGLDARGSEVNGDRARLQRLIYRIAAAVVRRAPEGTAIDIDSRSDGDRLTLRAVATATAPDWSDAAMLDLRIASLHAALAGGGLELEAIENRSVIELSLKRS